MLNSTEYFDRVRRLPTHLQLSYRVSVAVAFTAVFFACIALAVAVTVIGVHLAWDIRINMDMILSFGLPAVLAFLNTIGMTRFMHQPGQQTRAVLRRAAISGLRSGFIGGAVFATLWYLILRMGAIYYLDWEFLFHPSILVHAVIVGLALALAMAGFRALTSVLGDLMLRPFSGAAMKTASG